MVTPQARSSMGVVQLDREGCCTFVNGGWQRLSGMGSEEAHGEGWLRAVHPQDRERVRLWWKDILDSGNEFTCEYRLQSAAGEISWVLGSAVAIRDEAGRPLGYIETVADLTERKSFELELIRAREEADRASGAKTEFLSRMSHELRTPLNAILGFSQLLQIDAHENTIQKERADLIVKAGMHLMDLINDVLDLATIEQGRLAVADKAVDLRPVIDDCLRLIQPAATERKICIQDLTEGASLRVRGDSLRIRQVLLNLLSNAVKYNRTNGAVTLGLEHPKNGTVRVLVRDTGVGIPAAQMPGLFKPFSRLDINRSQVQGTGVGLALSKRLVEAMGGAIGADSIFGDGSTFWFELSRN